MMTIDAKTKSNMKWRSHFDEGTRLIAAELISMPTSMGWECLSSVHWPRQDAGQRGKETTSFDS